MMEVCLELWVCWDRRSRGNMVLWGSVGDWWENKGFVFILLGDVLLCFFVGLIIVIIIRIILIIFKLNIKFFLFVVLIFGSR